LLGARATTSLRVAHPSEVLMGAKGTSWALKGICTRSVGVRIPPLGADERPEGLGLDDHPRPGPIGATDTPDEGACRSIDPSAGAGSSVLRSGAARSAEAKITPRPSGGPRCPGRPRREDSPDGPSAE
jgi:hypothetical protein